MRIYSVLLIVFFLEMTELNQMDHTVIPTPNISVDDIILEKFRETSHQVNAVFDHLKPDTKLKNNVSNFVNYLKIFLNLH